MEKNKLKIIPNPLGFSYSFSLAACHRAEIGAYVFGAAIGLFVFIAFMYELYERGITSKDVLTSLGYAAWFFVPLVLLGLSMTIRTKRVQKIITLGKELDGEIISYHRISQHRKPDSTVLIVKFNYHGDYYCRLRVGYKPPEKVLASTKCKVYVYKDLVFVAGFERRTKGSG